jgi:hypothetical protein
VDGRVIFLGKELVTARLKYAQQKSSLFSLVNINTGEQNYQWNKAYFSLLTV